MKNPIVFVSSKGTYHVLVKDILNSENGKKLINEMAKLNLVQQTKKNKN